MGISPYMKNLRAHFGSQLVMTPSVAALIRNEAGQILFLVRADNGLWDLPAGAIDPGETPAQAVVRQGGQAASSGDNEGLWLVPSGPGRSASGWSRSP